MEKDGVFVFPGMNGFGNNSSIDPNLLLALNNGGGFGGNGSWIWILFLWLMWQNGYGNNGFGNGMGNNGVGFLSNQMNNDAGRDLLLQAINGRADAASQLAQLTHSSVDSVRNVLSTIQAAVQTTGLETINALQLGNANLSRQICECCCENRLAIANQTNALQQTMAANHAAATLQAAQNHADDRLDVCQQTNTLQNQAERDTTSILNAINAQNTMLAQEFCAIKEREMQDKINTQGDIITQLRGQISNDNQTLMFNRAISALDDKIDAIAAKQPNTVPVVYPNLTAVNNTPYNGGYPYGYGFGFNNGFGGSIVL